MIRKLLPVVLALVAFIGGAAGGDMLRAPAPGAQDSGPAPEGAGDAPDKPGASDTAETPAHGDKPANVAAPAAAGPAGASGGHGEGGHGGGGHGGGAADAPETAWFKFPQQFFVPVLHDGQLDSTMILSLSLEMPGSSLEDVNAREFKLRDGLLRQLLIHANTGGFDGNFTAEPQLRGLRDELLHTAQAILPEIDAILIGDIARQDR